MEMKKKPFDIEAWSRTLVVPVLTILFVAVGFYWQQKSTTESFKLTLDKHESQFKEVGNQFDKFNATLQKNYADWFAATKADSEKAEKNTKEERDIREKMREQFMQTFRQFGQSAAAMRVQVDTISKQLDGVTNKIDSISTQQKIN